MRLGILKNETDLKALECLGLGVERFRGKEIRRRKKTGNLQGGGKERKPHHLKVRGATSPTHKKKNAHI